MNITALSAAAPGLPAVSRRHVLAAGHLLALTSAPALAALEPEDPILPIYHRWQVARTEWWAAARAAERDGRDPCPIAEAAADREYAALDEMSDMEPRTMAGVAALAHCWWVCAGPSAIQGTPFWDTECGRWENRLIVSIWRGASCTTGYPTRLDEPDQGELTQDMASGPLAEGQS